MMLGDPTFSFLLARFFMPSFTISKSTSAYAGGHLTLSREFVCAVNNLCFLLSHSTLPFTYGQSSPVYPLYIYMYVLFILNCRVFLFCIVVTSFIVVLTK